MRGIAIAGAMLLVGMFVFVARWTEPAPRRAEPPRPIPSTGLAHDVFATAVSTNAPSEIASPSVNARGEPVPGGASGPVVAAVDRTPAEGPRDPGASSELPKDPAARLQALEPLQREVLSGLSEMGWRIAHCDIGDARLFVTLETLDGAVRIVDARLDLPASEDDGPRGDPLHVDEAVAHCVRGGLVRNVIGASHASPGRRWEMLYAP